MGLCVQWVGIARNDVKVQWFDWFAFVRPEGVKLVKNRNLCNLAESCGVGHANIYFNELFSRDGLVRASTELSTYWFCSVGV